MNWTGLSLLLAGYLLINGGNLNGQPFYSHHFAREIKKARGSFIAPVEGWYKIKLWPGVNNPGYDLALESKDHEFEIRYIVEPEYQRNIPHLECFTMASHLAVNDEYLDIRMNLFAEQEAYSLFNAEWAAYVDFIPKPTITDKHYGRLVTLYREGMALIHTILFFNYHDTEKDFRMYSLTFEPVPPP